jgi:hypothetical protein
MKSKSSLSLAISVATTIALAGFAQPAHAVSTYTDLTTWKTAVGSSSETTTFGTTFLTITAFSLTGGPTITGDPVESVRSAMDGPLGVADIPARFFGPREPKRILLLWAAMLADLVSSSNPTYSTPLILRWF